MITLAESIWRCSSLENEMLLEFWLVPQFLYLDFVVLIPALSRPDSVFQARSYAVR
jgi:hypothetical protein